MTDRTILSSINRPGRYLGHEYNAVGKDWQSAQIRFALIFPDLYEIGMSHQGLQILYHLLNDREEFLADRCYCPDIDLENMLRQKKTVLTSLESARPLTDFDILGITLPYELCYTNILTILDLARIPLYSRDRDSSFPLLLGGGACSLNPEPVADFFDAILLGDGEEAIIDIAELLAAHKNDQLARKDLLDLLAEIDGVYIPAHFDPEYSPDGKVLTMHRIGGNKDHISRRILHDLNQIDHLKRPLVPNAKIVHDRLGIEVARGCTRGCRFCQAGITYRPVRERKPEKIMELAKDGLAASGFEELALLSLSTGDYSCLEQTLPQLMDSFADRFVSVAMPSMRVGTLTPKIMEQVKRVRKTGFTLAPEAGSERLRRVINKGITEDDLIATCEEAFALGWRVIKFYFMIGLPTETDQDIDAIIQLVRKAMAVQGGGRPGKGKKQITVSVGTFVPKPHTPFQWERQLSVEESTQHIRRLQNGLPTKGCNFRYHSPQISYLEGVFSRGDRRLAKLMELAWQAGARLDGWDEHFDLTRWQKAAELCALNLDDFLRARTMDEILPWQHLQTGVDRQFLQDQLAKAQDEIYTPDCRYHACQKCGLCDFKTLMPIVYNRPDNTAEAAPLSSVAEQSADKVQRQVAGAADSGHFKYMVHYARTGEVCFLGHLEILQIIFRTLRRASIVTNFSQGFNPSPKISFGPALPVGTESLAEFIIMDLPAPLGDMQAIMNRINDKLIPGLRVTGIELHSGKVPQKIGITYSLTLPTKMTETERRKAEEFVASDSFIIGKTRKGKTSQIDIRPLITTFSLEIDGDAEIVQMEMVSASAEPGIKPLEALTQILDLDHERSLQTRIVKTGWHSLDAKKS
ncbi:TIGR03960 family B12-binding radical SAM protein [Desulfopila sp. IMCC35006]|uniref:TIGR03960 family B12-binding radical SAM protein n=1 Tax=Desulfopila sp. IMCC35006 TaxID=2569542 RepID=UPI0010AB9CCF|nr:TIGR03960 family B12-binding radical SAM protein [Desulfopila sp. IMCC35006]TKB28166.1 TIGR03960 family B12-binding radical SAM protein [Desulfopila sp. IMCC35006]